MDNEFNEDVIIMYRRNEQLKNDILKIIEECYTESKDSMIKSIAEIYNRIKED